MYLVAVAVVPSGLCTLISRFSNVPWLFLRRTILVLPFTLRLSPLNVRVVLLRPISVSTPLWLAE